MRIKNMKAMARARRRWRKKVLEGKARCTRNVEEERKKNRKKKETRKKKKTNKKKEKKKKRRKKKNNFRRH